EGIAARQAVQTAQNQAPEPASPPRADSGASSLHRTERELRLRAGLLRSLLLVVEGGPRSLLRVVEGLLRSHLAGMKRRPVSLLLVQQRLRRRLLRVVEGRQLGRGRGRMLRLEGRAVGRL